MPPFPGNTTVSWGRLCTHNPQMSNRCYSELPTNWQDRGETLSRNKHGGQTIVIPSVEDKRLPTVSYDERPLVAINLTVALMQLAQLRYGGGRQQMMFEMKKTVER